MIMAPPEVIDFIVVHELSHMKIRNHSRDYWRFIESILPGYKEQKVWLRENSHLLMI
jgi:predicted metal-dependent hydrolase